MKTVCLVTVTIGDININKYVDGEVSLIENELERIKHIDGYWVREAKSFNNNVISFEEFQQTLSK